MYQYSQDGIENGNAANDAFWTYTVANYLHVLLDSEADVNVAAFVAAMAQAQVQHADELSDCIWCMSIADMYHVPAEGGNALTIQQAYCFTAYLIETSSLNNYLDFISGKCTFEDAFGTDCPSAIAYWRSTLK